MCVALGLGLLLWGRVRALTQLRPSWTSEHRACGPRLDRREEALSAEILDVLQLNWHERLTGYDFLVNVRHLVVFHRTLQLQNEVLLFSFIKNAQTLLNLVHRLRQYFEALLNLIEGIAEGHFYLVVDFRQVDWHFVVWNGMF